MKNSTIVFYVLAAALMSQESLGQFNKGRWLAGGSVTLSTSSWKGSYVINQSGTQEQLKTRSFNFGLGPQAGYFVANFLAVGATLSLNASRTDWDAYDPSTGEFIVAVNKSRSISIGPFVRYYLPQSIFFQADVEFGTGRTSVQGGSLTNEGSSSDFNYGAALGYAYFLNDYVALEPTFGYLSQGSKYNDTTGRRGSFYLNAALTIYLGERK